MGLSVLEDKSKKPTDEDISSVLGEAKSLWDQLTGFVKENHAGIVEDWKHYGKSSGWTMKMLLKKRNLFFLYPNQGHFYVGFIFGDKAVQAVEGSGLPREIIDELVASPKYAEGRGLPVTVRNQADLENVKTLLSIKIKF